MPPNPPAFFGDLLPTPVIRENTWDVIARSRQLLKETEAIAKGYIPDKGRNQLLEHVGTARRLAENGVIRVDRQKQFVEDLVARGEDAGAAREALERDEKASSQYWRELEGLLDQLDRLMISD